MTVSHHGHLHHLRRRQRAGGGAPTSTYHLSVSVIPARPRTCTNYAGRGPGRGPRHHRFHLEHPRPPDDRLPEAQLQRPPPDHRRPRRHAHFARRQRGIPLRRSVATRPPIAAPQINFEHRGRGRASRSALFGIHAGMQFTPEGGPGPALEFSRACRRRAPGRCACATTSRPTPARSTPGASTSARQSRLRPAWSRARTRPRSYTSDFEADDGGFTHSGTADEWERGLPTFAPITTAHSGVNAWKTDLDNTYENNANSDLVSPTHQPDRADGAHHAQLVAEVPGGDGQLRHLLGGGAAGGRARHRPAAYSSGRARR